MIVTKNKIMKRLSTLISLTIVCSMFYIPQSHGILPQSSIITANGLLTEEASRTVSRIISEAMTTGLLDSTSPNAIQAAMEQAAANIVELGQGSAAAAEKITSSLSNEITDMVIDAVNEVEKVNALNIAHDTSIIEQYDVTLKVHDRLIEQVQQKILKSELGSEEVMEEEAEEAPWEEDAMDAADLGEDAMDTVDLGEDAMDTVDLGEIEDYIDMEAAEDFANIESSEMAGAEEALGATELGSETIMSMGMAGAEEALGATELGSETIIPMGMAGAEEAVGAVEALTLSSEAGYGVSMLGSEMMPMAMAGAEGAVGALGSLTELGSEAGYGVSMLGSEMMPMAMAGAEGAVGALGSLTELGSEAGAEALEMVTFTDLGETISTGIAETSFISGGGIASTILTGSAVDTALLAGATGAGALEATAAGTVVTSVVALEVLETIGLAALAIL